MLRCKRSLAILSEIAAASDGRIEILIAGIPSDAEFTDFARTVAAMTGVTFIGRYTADDLPALYGRVHFAWAIDYFEEGLNSTWLLPNRLYEALGHGAVPIALSHVETGAWLSRHDVGLVIESPEEVPGQLSTMTADDYAGLAIAVSAIPLAVTTMTSEENQQIVDAIVGNTIKNGVP